MNSEKEIKGIIKNIIKEELYPDFYLDEAIKILSENDEPSPVVFWDLTKDKIDKSKEHIKTKPQAIEYLNKFFKKIKKLPHKIKTKLTTYILISFIGILGLSTISSFIPKDMPEVKAEISNYIPKIKEKHINPKKSSQNLIDFLKYEEGSPKRKGEPILKAYSIGDGMITIGWGHAERISSSKYDLDSKITRNEAERLLKNDIEWAEGVLNRILNKWEKEGINVEIDQDMYDAMVSMIFNMGGGNFRKTKFIQLVKQGKYKEAQEEIPTTMVSYPGHIPRRKKEAEMFGKNLMSDRMAIREIRVILRKIISGG